jgi:probable rRNA maturation factor
MPRENSSLLFRHASRRLQRTGLKRFFLELAGRVAGGRAVTCLITTDRELRALNRKFRGKDYATDVLSFPSREGGEIAISLDRAAAQADEHGHNLEEEVRILILHGLLHLAGMDHRTDHGEMASAEARWRKRLGLPSGLIERAQA